MSQETNEFSDWKWWRRQVLFCTAAVTGIGIVWASVSAAWAFFELPAPVVLNARYERDMRSTNDSLRLMSASISTMASMMARWQRADTASELREVERQIALNQGKPDVLKILYGQRDNLMAQRDNDDALLRQILMPSGG